MCQFEGSIFFDSLHFKMTARAFEHKNVVMFMQEEGDANGSGICLAEIKMKY